MKLIFIFFIATLLNSIFGQCEDNEYSTIGVLDNINEEIYNDDESVNAYSIYSWTSDDINRILSGNGIPNHEVGTFPNAHNPNTISEQTVNEVFTICPTIVSENGEPVGGPAGAIAYAINSVKFDPATAGRCNDEGECSLAQGQGNWNIEALGHETFNFGDDMNHAHVQPSGEYHYHGMPELLIDFLGDNQGMTLVGWASDGFPVYARYGYSNPNDSTSELISLQPSWKLKDTPDEGRPDTLTALGGGQGITYPNIPIPMGAFTQDFEFEAGYGDLDECNGRIGVTPEFPDGIYYYMVTDEFPYFTRCLKGEIANGGGGVPDCEDVPPGNPCCGDGICGGPENEDNCPIDCATGNTGPSLINFSIYGDTVNTSQESINIGFTLNAEDSDDYLSSYILRLIINGGPINGGEMLESSGLFAENVMSSTIASSIEIPMGSTEGTWNIRIILEDNFGTITNLGPNDLENQNFQNYIYVNNAILGSNYENVPIQYFLHQNYPNPFNPVTTLQYNLPEDIFVKITIYDMLGNVISNLISEVQNTGYKSVQWNATNNQGQPVSAGLYLYSIDTRKFRKTKKMILIK
tara:strand:+ start:219 stop:1955 length:1737 start_codon:yes stop_codon:yes gene_type:complete